MLKSKTSIENKDFSIINDHWIPVERNLSREKTGSTPTVEFSKTTFTERGGNEKI